MPWRLPPLNTIPPSAPPETRTENVPPLSARADKAGLWQRLLPGMASNRAYQNAVRLLEAGQWEAAIAAFEKITARLRPSHALTGELARFYLCEAHLGYALSLFTAAPNNVESVQKALSQLQEAAVLGPQYAEVFYHLGRIYLHDNRNEDALVALDRAAEINPDYARAHLLRGVALYRNGEHEGGLMVAEVAASLDTMLSTSLLLDAHFADVHQKYEEAARLLLQMNEIIADAVIQ